MSSTKGKAYCQKLSGLDILKQLCLQEIAHRTMYRSIRGQKPKTITSQIL